MEFNAYNLQQQIPYYLTSGEQEVVWRELKAIASGETANYFLNPRRDKFEDRMLQDDGCQGFQLFSSDTDRQRSIKGLVLSKFL